MRGRTAKGLVAASLFLAIAGTRLWSARVEGFRHDRPGTAPVSAGVARDGRCEDPAENHVLRKSSREWIALLPRANGSFATRFFPDRAGARAAVEPIETPLDLRSMMAAHEVWFEPVRDRLARLAGPIGALSFTGRVKAFRTLKRKIFTRVLAKGPAFRMGQICDVIAFRYVVRDKAALLAARALLEKEFGGDVLGVSFKDPRRGYRALHVNVQVAPAVRAEIQVQTRRANRVASWAHDRVYKGHENRDPAYFRRLEHYGEELFTYANSLDDGARPARYPDASGIGQGDVLDHETLD